MKLEEFNKINDSIEELNSKKFFNVKEICFPSERISFISINCNYYSIDLKISLLTKSEGFLVQIESKNEKFCVQKKDKWQSF